MSHASPKFVQVGYTGFYFNKKSWKIAADKLICVFLGYNVWFIVFKLLSDWQMKIQTWKLKVF